MSGQLPSSIAERMVLTDARATGYLDAICGGHPVHSSREIARAAGFAELPLSGVHLVGAATGVLTRRLADRAVQVLETHARFLRPIYVGQPFE